VGEGAEGQKYKIKPLGLDLGVPSEMGVESGEGRWHGGTDEVVVVVGCCVRKCEVGECVCAKKPKPSHCGSFQVHHVNSKGRRLGGVVWWCV